MALPIKRGGSNSGGGYLNGVSGFIRGYKFEAGNEGTGKNGRWALYSVRLTVQADGSEPVDQFFDGGFLYGDNSISADGLTIGGNDNYSLDASTPWGKFVVSLVEGEGNRMPEAVLEAGQLRNFEAIIGSRVTFARVIDEEATFEKGAAKLKKKGIKNPTREQAIEAGKRPGKKGTPNESKLYMLDQLLVAEVLALPEVKAAGRKVAAKPAAAKTATKPAAAAADTTAVDGVLVDLLAGTPDNTVARTNLSSAFVRYALAKKLADREPIRKVLTSPEYINGAAERGLIVVDGDNEKTQTLTLVAA